MSDRYSWLLAAWLALLAIGAPAQVFQVKMKNGDVLSGTLRSIDGSRIVLQTDYAPSLDLPLDKVAEVCGKSDARVRMRDGSTLATTLTGWSGGALRLASGEDRFTLESARVQTIELTPADLEAKVDLRVEVGRLEGLAEIQPKRWSGAINFGYSLTRGNASTDDLYLRFNSGYARRRDTFSFGAHALYGVQNDKTSRNELYGFFRYDYKLPKRYFVFGMVSGEYDEVEGIDLRHTWNAGVGYSLVARPGLSVDAGAGCGFLQEIYPVMDSNSDASALLEEHLNWKLNSRMALAQNFMFIPYLTGAARYRVVFDASLNVALIHTFKFNIGMIDRFDSRPLPDVLKNDFTMLMGVGWVF